MRVSGGGGGGSGEDLSSRPYAWLRPDFVPPSPFLVVKDPQAESTRVVVEPHLVDAEFRKAWMPYFCRSGHPQVSVDQFLGFIGHFLPQEDFLDLPRITGRDLQEVARSKKATAGGLDGWACNEVKALPLPCRFRVLLFFWSLLSLLAFGLRVFWMRILP